VLASPSRIAPDQLARANRSARVTGVSGQLVLGGAGGRRIEIHEIEGSVHANGFLLVWLPQERLLVEADAYTPGAPGAAPPALPNANNLNLADNIARLRLDVDRILPLHGRMVALSELQTAIGRKP